MKCAFRNHFCTNICSVQTVARSIRAVNLTLRHSYLDLPKLEGYFKGMYHVSLSRSDPTSSVVSLCCEGFYFIYTYLIFSAVFNIELSTFICTVAVWHSETASETDYCFLSFPVLWSLYHPLTLLTQRTWESIK